MKEDKQIEVKIDGEDQAQAHDRIPFDNIYIQLLCLNKNSSNDEFLSLFKDMNDKGISKTTAKIVKIFSKENNLKILSLLIPRLLKITKQLSKSRDNCNQTCTEHDAQFIYHSFRCVYVLLKMKIGDYQFLLNNDQFYKCLIECFKYFSEKYTCNIEIGNLIQEACLTCLDSLFRSSSSKSKMIIIEFVRKSNSGFLFFKYLRLSTTGNTQTKYLCLKFLVHVFWRTSTHYYISILISSFVKNNKACEWIFSTFLDWSQDLLTVLHYAHGNQNMLREKFRRVEYILDMIYLTTVETSAQQMIVKQLEKEVFGDGKCDNKILDMICQLMSLSLTNDPRYYGCDNNEGFEIQIGKWNKCAYLLGETGIVTLKLALVRAFGGIGDLIGMYGIHHKGKINLEAFAKFLHFHAHVIDKNENGYRGYLQQTVCFYDGTIKQNKQIRDYFQNYYSQSKHLFQVLHDVRIRVKKSQRKCLESFLLQFETS